MGILHLVNKAGNLIPHRGRRFILDRLGLGKIFAQITAGQTETATLPNGLTMYFNPVMHWNVTSPKGHEPEITAVLQRFLKPGSVFYDIGANIGLHSLIASSIVGSGCVLAFEPGEINLRYFRQSIEQNGISNVFLRPIAIGPADGMMTFDRRGPMSGKLIKEGEKAFDPVTIPVRTIDSLVAEGQPFPDVIKIDIEGGEGDALEGASEVLKSCPVVICEMHPWAVGGIGRAELALAKAGYTVVRLPELSVSSGDDVFHIVATKSLLHSDQQRQI
jgi:FkbM family methyltransferase